MDLQTKKGKKQNNTGNLPEYNFKHFRNCHTPNPASFYMLGTYQFCHTQRNKDVNVKKITADSHPWQ